MYSKKQRIAAMAGIVLLVLLYVITLICAIFNFDGANKMFMVSLFASIAVPLLLWIYIAIYGKLTNKKTIADMFPKTEEEEEILKKAKEEQLGKSSTKGKK